HEGFDVGISPAPFPKDPTGNRPRKSSRSSRKPRLSRGFRVFRGRPWTRKLFFHQKTETDGKSKNILGKKERKPCAE
ncbi:MAG: hypothetical protein ACLR2P_19630, partial [Bilophila wadsworthia]